MSGLGARVWWRQFRADLWADAVIALVVAGTVFLVAAAPRALDHAASADLAQTIATATPEERNLQFVARTEIGAGPPSDPFFNIDVLSERRREEHVPESIDRLIGSEQWVVDTPEFVVTSFPDEIEGPFPTTFRFRYQEGIEDRARLVEGSWPSAQDPIVRSEGTECPDDIDVETFEPELDVDCRVVVIPVFETVVTQQTAEDMMVDVGDVVTLRPSLTDLSFRTVRVDAGSIRFALRVAGIVELDDPELEYWFADMSLHRPSVTENPDFRFVYAAGLMSPDQYRPLRDAAPGVEMNFGWRHLLDAELVEDADAEQIRADVAKIAPPDVDVVTLLPELLGTHLAQRRLATVLLSLTGIGIAVAALTAVWSIAGVDGVRRRRVTNLFVDRGASRGQVVVHSLRTALVVTVSAAIVGWLVALTAFPATGHGPTWLPAGAVAALAALAIVVNGRPDNTRPDPPRSRRIVVEVLLLVAALGSVALVRRRSSDVADALDRGFDWTLSLVPVLVAVLVAAVVLRVLGPLGRGVAALGARLRSLDWFVGARRMSTQPPPMRAPVVAIVVGAAMAVFAVIVWTSLDRSRELASWQAVGGAARAETLNPDLPMPIALQDELVRQDPGIVFGANLRVQRFDRPEGGFVTDVVAIDVDEYDRMLGDRAADLGVDLDVLVPQGGDLPAMLVAVPDSGLMPRVGTGAAFENGAYVVPFRFVAASPSFPGVSEGRPTIVVDRAALLERTDPRVVQATYALLGEGDIDSEVQALLDDPRVLVSWRTRAEWLDRVSGDPLSVWTNRFVGLLAVVALALAVLTAGAAAVITGSERRRELGVLAILGMERGAVARLVAIELLPGALIASAAGGVAGAITSVVLADHLSLGTFAEGADGLVVVDWRWIAVTVAAMFAGAATAVWATVRSLGRIDHAMLLRKGEIE